jgi:putative thioredoxin
MSEATHKFVATTDNFGATVVDGSHERPVLVDFWAPWCGPCRTLMPLLDRIADDYGGRFALAKVNTDEEPQIAAQFGIRSIPTVILFHGGQVVEQFVGVQPEASVRALLDRYVAPAADEDPDSPSVLVAEAETRLAVRDAAGAATVIERLAARDPEHRSLRSLRARAVFVDAVAERPDFAALRAALEGDPADAAARHALAAHHALAGDYATALAEWLELMRRDRRYGDDLARRSLLAVFDLLGDGDELVTAYRRRMAALLH